MPPCLVKAGENQSKQPHDSLSERLSQTTSGAKRFRNYIYINCLYTSILYIYIFLVNFHFPADCFTSGDASSESVWVWRAGYTAQFGDAPTTPTLKKKRLRSEMYAHSFAKSTRKTCHFMKTSSCQLPFPS